MRFSIEAGVPAARRVADWPFCLPLPETNDRIGTQNPRVLESYREEN